jgi:hypothetical protein
VGWFGSVGKASSRCRRWLILLSGIIRVVFMLETRWGAKCWDPITEGYSIPNTEEKCEGGLEHTGEQ